MLLLFTLKYYLWFLIYCVLLINTFLFPKFTFIQRGNSWWKLMKTESKYEIMSVSKEVRLFLNQHRIRCKVIIFIFPATSFQGCPPGSLSNMYIDIIYDEQPFTARHVRKTSLPPRYTVNSPSHASLPILRRDKWPLKCKYYNKPQIEY